MTERTTALSAELIAKVRALRELIGLSAQDLADAMTKQGFPTTRSVISNYENGRKESISVDFLNAAATALYTTLADLLTKPVVCPNCKGEPPEGFTCNVCGVTV
jgi:transcriptional regulator with XRE-family HTH domain